MKKKRLKIWWFKKKYVNLSCDLFILNLILHRNIMARHIRTLTVYFDTEINYREIPLFRGVVLHCLGDSGNLLFHNHTGASTFRYAYPLIQYKRLNGKAAITGIEQGADIIGQFAANAPEVITVGERKASCKVERMQPARLLMQTWNHPFSYHLVRWLPLNAKNYLIYKETEEVDARRELLESILKGNLLSMLKGLGIHIEDELMVSITQLDEPYIVYNKGVALMAFNAMFSSNLSIPDNLGVGKNASIGYGVVYRERKKEK